VQSCVLACTADDRVCGRGEPFDHRSGPDVPEPDGPVSARGGDELAVWAERHSIDGIGMRFRLPDLPRLVLASRGGEMTPVRAELDIEDFVPVTNELKELSRGRDIADCRHLVLAGACHAA